MKAAISVSVLFVVFAAPAADTEAVLPKPESAVSPAVLAGAVTIPRVLSFQGRLTDTAGVPVPDSVYQVRFRLYEHETGGPILWHELQPIRTEAGLFSALLGSASPIESVPEQGGLYLGIKVAEDPEMVPRPRLVSAAYSFLSSRSRHADTAWFAVSGGAGDNAWTRGVPDSVLFTVTQLGIARGGALNTLLGNGRHTHVNLGIACTTGTSGQDYAYSTVSGGGHNRATDDYCTVGGGGGNVASGYYATVAGGAQNTASSGNCTVGGGLSNAATVTNATVAGGKFGVASGYCAAVGGGVDNIAGAEFATVPGGSGNHATGGNAVVAGGSGNTANRTNSAVGGGLLNVAGGIGATVAGGEGCLAAGDHGLAAGFGSSVDSGHGNSVAFNGQATTASGQLRCGILSKTGGSFTIDHPLRPMSAVLNHYFVESPEMRNVYEGEAVLDRSGQAEVRLPEYFSALNRRPRVQLTGVGSHEVYVAEDVSGNRFAIGGPAGAKVYWQVTGERKDRGAEAIRLMMPVEQPKTGGLAGRSLDDDFLVTAMRQLEDQGLGSGFRFRTAEGRRKYEQLRRALADADR
ncbi:MAG: hypothetical protein JSU73_12340 [candidate division WOR-3 bacterium]|nr:MAG: hypothetical protein JSU73_12340 [candidate division WOR-3 bacterium]